MHAAAAAATDTAVFPEACRPEPARNPQFDACAVASVRSTADEVSVPATLELSAKTSSGVPVAGCNSPSGVLMTSSIGGRLGMRSSMLLRVAASWA